MLAEVTLIGRIGRDAELRCTPGGQSVASFSLATSKKKKTENGTKELTTWFRVSAWGALADFAAEHCKKGALVAIQGELEADPETGGPRMFKRKDLTWGATFDVTATKLRMIQYAEAEAVQGEIPF